MKYTEDVKLNKAMEKVADMQLSHNEEKDKTRNMLLLAIELMPYIKSKLNGVPNKERRYVAMRILDNTGYGIYRTKELDYLFLKNGIFSHNIEWIF